MSFSKEVQGRWLKTAVVALDTFLRNEQTATPVLDNVAEGNEVAEWTRRLREISKRLLAEEAEESEVTEALTWWATQDEEKYDPHIVTLMERVAAS